MSKSTLYRTIKNPEKGPRHPLAQALLILATLVDGRVEAVLSVVKQDGSYTFTAGDFEIDVSYHHDATIDPDHPEWIVVRTVTPPEGEPVHLFLTRAEFTELFLGILKSTPGALPEPQPQPEQPNAEEPQEPAA